MHQQHLGFHEHRVDLVIANPGYCVTMEAEFGISRLAMLDTEESHR